MRLFYDHFERLIQTLSDKQNISICLTGGRSAFLLFNSSRFQSLLSKRNFDVFWSDERVVPLESNFSNYKQFLESSLGRRNFTHLNLFPLYDKTFSSVDKSEEFASHFPCQLDILFLSLGNDGHIASLFPHSAALNESVKKIALVFDSPSFPSARYTITPPVILGAKNIFLFVLGAQKANLLAHIFDDSFQINDYPVKLLKNAIFVLDEDAFDVLNCSLQEKLNGLNILKF